MQKRKSRHPGPMRMQPVSHSSTMLAAVLPAMPGSDDLDVPKVSTPKVESRSDAVRAAKARITRRNSLRKQRQAQKE